MAKINTRGKAKEYERRMYLIVFVLMIMRNDLAVINVLLLGLRIQIMDFFRGLTIIMVKRIYFMHAGAGLKV